MSTIFKRNPHEDLSCHPFPQSPDRHGRSGTYAARWDQTLKSLPLSHELFRAWAVVRDNPVKDDNNRKPRPLGVHGRQQAEIIWKQWELFCAENAVQWHEVTPLHFQKFNMRINPRGKTVGTATPTTQRRYWRTLHDIYSMAVIEGYMESNPAANSKSLGIPAQEERKSDLIDSNYWQILMDSIPGGFTFLDVRKRVLLLLVMRAALTVGEIVAIRIKDVYPYEPTKEYAGLPLLEKDPNWKSNEPHPIYALHITNADEKSRPAKKRTLVLDTRTSKAMHDWLSIRLKFDNVKVKDLLIVSAEKNPQITTRTILKVCTDHINSVKKPNSDMEFRHPSPNTLRNTCIDLWRHNPTITEAEVSRRVGVVPGSLSIRMPRVNPILHLGKFHAPG